MKRASSFLWRVWRAPDVLLWLWVGNLSTTICLYLRYRGMTPPPAPCPRKGQGAQTAFVLCSRIPPDHNPPYPPLVSALRLVCCLRVQILVVPLHVYTCSHRVFTHGAPCMGLLGPCRLKFFPRQSIYYHRAILRVPVNNGRLQTLPHAGHWLFGC